jgi:hypothetical protein
MYAFSLIIIEIVVTPSSSIALIAEFIGAFALVISIFVSGATLAFIVFAAGGNAGGAAGGNAGGAAASYVYNLLK